MFVIVSYHILHNYVVEQIFSETRCLERQYRLFQFQLLFNILNNLKTLKEKKITEKSSHQIFAEFMNIAK